MEGFYMRDLAYKFYVTEMYSEGCIKPEDMHPHDLDFIATMDIFQHWLDQFHPIQISFMLLEMHRYDN